MQTYETWKPTTWDCKSHVVFIPKYRRKALYAQLRRELGPVFRDLAEQKECKVEAGHLMPDHVAGVCWAAKELRRSAFLGAGLLGINGRQKRGCRA